MVFLSAPFQLNPLLQIASSIPSNWASPEAGSIALQHTARRIQRSMVWTIRNNAFKKPTSRSASRNSSQVTVPLQRLRPQSDTQSLKMHCTTKQEKCRKLQPGESQKYPFTISQHLLNPSTKSSLFLMRLGFYTCWGAGSVLHFGYLTPLSTISSQWLHSPILPTQVPQRVAKKMSGAYQEAHLWRRFTAEPVVDDPGQQSSRAA